MDHSESIRLMAAEKYLLGELTPELRDQLRNTSSIARSALSTYGQALRWWNTAK